MKVSSYNEKREEYIARMMAEGCRVVFPADDELQIDIDTEEHYATFCKAIEALERNDFPVETLHFAPSRSGLPGRHVVLRVPFKLEPWQRIALQAALGSDPMRELLSALRLIRGDVHPTLLVEAS